MLNCRLPVPQAKAFVACRKITTVVVNKLTDSAVHTLAMDTFKSNFFAKPRILVSGDLEQRILLACLGNPDPVGSPTDKKTFDNEKTEEAPPRRDRAEAARRGCDAQRRQGFGGSAAGL